MEKTYYLPAEWHKQSYIQLTWPHADTDWAYMLDEVETCFVRLATEIASRQPLLLVAPEFPAALADFPYRDQITFVKCPTNDTVICSRPAYLTATTSTAATSCLKAVPLKATEKVPCSPPPPACWLLIAMTPSRAKTSKPT